MACAIVFAGRPCSGLAAEEVSPAMHSAQYERVHDSRRKPADSKSDSRSNSKSSSESSSKSNSESGLESNSESGLKSVSESESKSKTASKRHPPTRDEIRKRAQFYTTRRDFTLALPLWYQLAKPGDAQAEAFLGWCQLQLGDKTEAIKHINRSIALNPRTVEGFRYLGYYLIGEGKIPEAVTAFRTSMKFDPHHKCNCGDLEKLILSKSKHRKP